MRVRQQPRRRRRALRARARGRIELHLAGHGAAGPLPRRRPHAAVAAARGVGVGLRGRVLPVRGLRELAVPRRRRPASRDDARGLSTGTSVGDGCSHGADVRIGMEKDGPAAWCEASPPKLWRGEQLGDRSRACGDAGWRPESLAGQCFGLGDRVAGVASERACRDHCCERSGGKKRCGTWQRRAASRGRGDVRGRSTGNHRHRRVGGATTRAASRATRGGATRPTTGAPSRAGGRSRRAGPTRRPRY